MKLQAVTICINYADFLECVVANRRHFDRWVVVTCAEDVRTQELCARHGMECIVSTLLQADGKNFHAVDAKWHVLNEGLDALGQEGWAVVLDADVLLPRHFRERLEGMTLEPGCIYGVAGRKVIEDREAFEQARECEPWTTLVGRNSQVIGYFNLFCLETTPNRYPRRALGQRGGAHDDWRFTTSFAEDKRGMLPMTVIHTGSPGVNWGRRVAAEYEAGERRTSNIERSMRNGETAEFGRQEGGKRTGSFLESFLPSCLPNSSRQGATAAVVGYFPGGRWREVAAGFEKVWMVDHFQVHALSGHPMGEADRAVLRRLFAEETVGIGTQASSLCGGQASSVPPGSEVAGRMPADRTGWKPVFHMLGAHSVGNLAKIPDGSVDLLYLPGEVAPDWLATALRHWMPKLRDGAVVCGDLFGLPHWREATFSLSLLLGAPDEVSPDGFWRKTMRAADWKLAPVGEKDADLSEEDGVLLVNRAKETLEKLLLSLHSVTRHWAGPVAVFHWGEEDPSLTIACARLGVALWNVGSLSAVEEAETWLEAAAAIQPFRRALMLQPGMLAVGELAPLFEDGMPITEETDATPLLAERGGALVAVRGASAGKFAGEAAVLVCAGEPDGWTDDAWAAWSQAEAGMAQALAGEVRVAADATVVTIVEAEMAGDFQRAWTTWRFPRGTPVLVVLVGIAAEDLWLPGVTRETRIVSLSQKQANDLPWLLGWIAGEIGTGRVICLPPAARALPGAELWPGTEWRAVSAVLHESRAARGGVAATGNRFVPRSFAGVVDRTRLFELAASGLAGAKTLHDVPLAMHKALRLGMASVDLSAKGWRWPVSHRYVASGSRAADTRVSVLRGGDDRLRLAEDVVVINLPERTDRRKRFSKWMERHGVHFRFVDGVRVRDEEIDPAEIAEVTRDHFKIDGGWEAYLRGTVGCRRAYLRCLEEAYAAGLKSLLIMEDDAHLVAGWLERYMAAMEELPAGWLQLYLSALDFRSSEKVSPHLHRLAGSYQTTAILYSEAGIEAAVKAARSSRCDIDEWLAKHLHPYGNSYVIRPEITYQDGGVSDIRSVDRGVTP